jgi:hypothetical protein
MFKRRLFWIVLAVASLVAVVAADTGMAPGAAQFAGVFLTLMMLAVAVLGALWPRRDER